MGVSVLLGKRRKTGRFWKNWTCSWYAFVVSQCIPRLNSCVWEWQKI